MKLGRITALTIALVSILNFSAVQAEAQTTPRKYGIFYLALGCLSTSMNYDISKYLSGEQALGPVPEIHWWTEPAKGYYCITRDRQVARDHAVQLRDAGIDFVYFDATNFVDATNGQAIASSLDPLKVVLEEWSQIPGAPKVAVWVPFAAGATMPDALDAILSQYPSMNFQYGGKPLMFIATNPAFPVDSALKTRMGQKYTLRNLWAYRTDRTSWSFMEKCLGDFKSTGGTGTCNQRVAYNPSLTAVEQISVSAAYQNTYMSNFDTAVPQFGGKTLIAQMKRADAYPNAPIVMITGWNELVAQRLCHINLLPTADCSAPGASDNIQGRPVFTDQYDKDYNRDIEPTKRYGDGMYRTLKNEVLKRKAKITGYLDGAVKNADGSVTVRGWACMTTVGESIDTHVYLGGTAGSTGATFAAAGPSSLPSEPAIASACQDVLNVPHRFSIVIPAATAAGKKGKYIYVHGIHKYGGANAAIPNSGKIRMP